MSNLSGEPTLASPVVVENPIQFTDLNLPAPLLKALAVAGFDCPTPIQREAIPLILAGRDMIGQAETGSGKTAAFCLPALARLQYNKGVEVLVLVPTRELAEQVVQEYRRLGEFTKVRVVSVIGGQSARQQISSVNQGAQVVVATPGRLLDHLESGQLKGFQPRLVILDEADEMLDMGFIDDIRKILAFVPAARQTLLFSATLPPAIARLAREHLSDPAHIALNNKRSSHQSISQYLYVVGQHERTEALIRLIETESPEKAIVFCRTRLETEELGQLLRSRGVQAHALHGDLSQQARSQVIRDVKEGLVPVLVATDVASRGLDITGLSHVFNFHPPENSERYTHRIGRTGRAGHKGTAISLATPAELRAHSFYRHYSLDNFKLAAVPSRQQAEKELSARLLEAMSGTETTREARELCELFAARGEAELFEFLTKVTSYLFRQEVRIEGPESIGLSPDEVKNAMRPRFKAKSGPARPSPYARPQGHRAAPAQHKGKGRPWAVAGGKRPGAKQRAGSPRQPA